MFNNKIALIVHACDRYNLLYRGFYYFFQFHSGIDLPCKKYFALENRDDQFPGFETIQSGQGEWSDRLSKILHRIPEKYILYFQEDFWIDGPMHLQFFAELFDLMAKDEIDCIKLHRCHDYKIKKIIGNIQGLELAELDINKSGYLMSHQVSLWKKQVFLQQLPSGEHPWRNERKGSKRLKKRSDLKIYQMDYFKNNGHPEHNQRQNQQMMSSYNTVSDRSMLNSYAPPYVESLLQQSNPSWQEYGRLLSKHLELGLTHEGQYPKQGLRQKVKQLFGV